MHGCNSTKQKTKKRDALEKVVPKNTTNILTSKSKVKLLLDIRLSLVREIFFKPVMCGERLQVIAVEKLQTNHIYLRKM